MSTAYALADRVLDVKIDGRVTPEAIGVFRGAVVEALGTDGPFTICFDRSSMTATTKEGRAALVRWADEDLPLLAGRCVGWADVYDARRAASLANAAAARGAEPESGSTMRAAVLASGPRDASVARACLRWSLFIQRGTRERPDDSPATG